MKYFNEKVSPVFVALFSGRMIQFAANGFIGLFLPIFLLTKLNYRIEYVFLYFLIGYVGYAVILPFGARLLNKIGLRRSLRISVFLDGAFYGCLFFIDKSPLFFLVLSIIIIVIDRLMFWLPFHIDFAKFTERSNRGKEVSLLWGAKSFLGVALPVVAGFLIGRFGFNPMFMIAIVLFTAAFIPFLMLPRTEERFSWGIAETFGRFFSKDNRSLVIANLANGAENAVGVIIWPIFIWQLLNGNFFEVGAISSLIIFVSIILQMAVGKYADLFNKRKMLHWGSAFYASGWLAKIFVLTAGQIFIVGAYHSLTQIFKDTPFDTLNYEIMADHGHYVDEYTVLKEMAVMLGKTLMLIFAIFVALNFGLNWTFGLAALASLFINML